jgi:murE/murF fusion protein
VPDERVALFEDLKKFSGEIAHRFYQAPSEQIEVLAVTGTNGKTSTCWWLAQALSLFNPERPCAVAGTLGLGSVKGEQGLGLIESALTTPDPCTWQAALRGFVDAGMAACAVEASSIGLAEQRLRGTRIRLAILTNFTQDHLDYHGSMTDYWAAKAALFAWPGLRAAVINVDDPKGRELAQQLLQSQTVPDVWSVGVQIAVGSTQLVPRLRAEQVSQDGQGLAFEVVETTPSGSHRFQVSSRLTGLFNVSNLLCVIAGLRHMGVALADAAGVCAQLRPVPGRMQVVGFEGGEDQQGGPNEYLPLAVVDYAHTPDAVVKALQSLRPMAQARRGRLWCVLGCGGGRDPSKRPLMTALAAQHADHLVLTSDNPRWEPVEHILSQMLLGVEGRSGVVVQADRAQAVTHAIAHASAGDVVLVAGKGHERYQEVAGVRHPFDDVEQVQRALRQRAENVMLDGPQVQAWVSAALADAEWVAGDGSAQHLAPVRRVHTDTRTMRAGDLFVALRGERFDANQFLDQARHCGAVAAVCSDRAALVASGLPGWVVHDSLWALGELARSWRARLTMPLIAVTGSNGKTTVTQMLARILQAAHGSNMWATQGNFNNEIGVPLTLLGLRAHHQLAVVELGMNHPGEIARLARMAQPTVALVNNAQREHLEFMATVEAVAQENGAAIAALPAHGVAVFPAQDPYSPVWQALAADRECQCFGVPQLVSALTGLVPAASVLELQGWCVSADDAWQVQVVAGSQVINFSLQVPGLHNVHNAMAAVACARAAGVAPASIAAGLSAFEPVSGRSRAFKLKIQSRTLTVVDDTYNANPDSVRAAIDGLAHWPSPRLLVLGDMSEVGHEGPAFHAEMGRHAQTCGIDVLLALGEQSRVAVTAFCAQQAERKNAATPELEALHFDDLEALLQALKPRLVQARSVLVKGSRFMRMERVIQAMQTWAALPPTGGLPYAA